MPHRHLVFLYECGKRSSFFNPYYMETRSYRFYKKDIHLLKRMPSMKERRKYERLSFAFPVRLETMSANGKKVLDLVTKDISASGTFIPTLTSFPEDARFILTLTFPSNKFHTVKTVKSLNGCKGSLVRSTPNGIAIQFDRECQMECLKIF